MNILYGAGFGFANDGSGGGGGPPAGPAGGDLAGTYPNPTVRSVTNQFQWRNNITPAALTGNETDYSPVGLDTATVLQLTTDGLANYDINGIDTTVFTAPPLNTTINGIYLMIQNINTPGATTDIVLKTGTGAAGNQFLFSGDITLAALESAIILYDLATGTWRIVGTSAGQAGAAGLWAQDAGGGLYSTGVNPSTATGVDAFAGGGGNTASGNSSTSVGYNNDANGGDSIAVGKDNLVVGSASSAFGTSNTAGGSLALSAGVGNTAASTLSTAVGYFNSVGAGGGAADRGVAVGYNNTIFDGWTDCTAVGVSNVTINGTAAVAIGKSSTASGNYAVAIGSGIIFNTAAASYATSIGQDNNVTAMDSVALGRENRALDDGSGVTYRITVIGVDNINSANESATIGFNNRLTSIFGAGGSQSYILGSTNSDSTFAFGINTPFTDIHGSSNIVNNSGGVETRVSILGGYNEVDASYVFIVGHSNTGVGGAGTRITGNHTQIVGDTNEVTGANNHVGGQLHSIDGTDNTVLGVNNTVAGDFNFVFAHSNTVTGNNNIRIGIAGPITGGEDIAIGSGASVVGADGANAYGTNAVNTIDSTTVITGPCISPKSPAGPTDVNRWSELGCAPWVARTELLDLTVVQTIQVSLPVASASGSLPRFQIDEVGIIINDPTSNIDVGGGGTPCTASFGINGNTTKYLAATAMNIAVSAFKRDIFTTLLADDGEQTLVFDVTVAAVNGGAGTGLQGFAYWRGIVYPEEP